MKGYDKTVYDKLWKENRLRLMIREMFINKPFVFNSGIAMAIRSDFVNKMIRRVLK